MDPFLKDVLVVCAAIAGPIATFAVLSYRVRRLEDEVGMTHDKGMRKKLHDHAGMLTQHELRITNLERK